VDEFDIIRRFFQRPGQRVAPGVVAGVGDDCALLLPTPGMQLAVSSDVLLEGRHFFADVPPRLLGHKALAVNLSDLAACGASPLGFTLALALPRVDAPWLQAFADGLLALADACGCALVGGDTTEGPLNICITVLGQVPAGQALLRNGARAGDDIWVSGHLGDARLALEVCRGHVTLPAAAQGVLAAACMRLQAPTPRLALGQALRGIASSAIDVSDGLLGDLGHVLEQSGVGALLDTRRTDTLLAAAQHRASGHLPPEWVHRWTLAGGDDYELCFTAAPAQRQAVLAAAHSAATPVTRIGCIEATPGLHLLDRQGQRIAPAPQWAAFAHFSQERP